MYFDDSSYIDFNIFTLERVADSAFLEGMKKEALIFKNKAKQLKQLKKEKNNPTKKEIDKIVNASEI